MALATHTRSSAPMAGLLADMKLRRKVRSREGGLRIIDAQPGTPQTVAAAVCYLAVGQALVFELGWAEHIERARRSLYNDRCRKPGGSRFVTRSHGRLLVVLRVE